MEFERRRHDHSHMNIAPLVDVVFLLLLFFMLTSHLMQEPAIKIKLPESKTAEAQRDEIKTVYIAKDGSLYFMNRPVSLNTLKREIQTTIKDPEHDFVRIKADREADVGVLVSVIDEIRLSGLKNYSIMTVRQ
jgi:biopolymer transport protein ExbD